MQNAVCFIGHRTIEDTPRLRQRLHDTLIDLIARGTVNFIFGDHSEFNTLCYDAVSALRETYPHIRRIRFRKEYPELNEENRLYFLNGYEDNICPIGVEKAGRAAYIERNQAMIRESEICVFYYRKDYLPPRRKNGRQSLCDYQPKSGTAIAYAYAERQDKEIINLI